MATRKGNSSKVQAQEGLVTGDRNDEADLGTLRDIIGRKRTWKALGERMSDVRTVVEKLLDERAQKIPCAEVHWERRRRCYAYRPAGPEDDVPVQGFHAVLAPNSLDIVQSVPAGSDGAKSLPSGEWGLKVRGGRGRLNVIPVPSSVLVASQGDSIPDRIMNLVRRDNVAPQVLLNWLAHVVSSGDYPRLGKKRE